MKNFKKISSAIAALALAATMAAPMAMNVMTASAAGSIEITNEKADHVYEAYQIFKGTLGADGSLGQIDWGANVDTKNTVDGKKLVEAIREIEGFELVETAKDIADKLNDLASSEFDANVTKKFADVISKYLTATDKKSGEQSQGKYTIDGLGDGYYLVKDEDGSLDGENDAYTRYILKVAGTATVLKPKSSLPTVEKKIKENVKTVTNPDAAKYGDIQFNDVGDFCIGEDITFLLYGTMPDTIGDYDRYYYEFSDTFESGKFDLLDIDSSDNETVFSENDITVKIGDFVIPYKVTVGGAEYTNWILEKNTNGFNVVFNDIKKVYKENKDTDDKSYVPIDKTTKVTVEYHAKLTATAQIGNDGQWNAVDLTYSNNSNVKGNGDNTPGQNDKDKPDDTGKTLKDYVIAFAYEAVIDKYYDSKSDNNKPQDDEVKFKIYRKTSSGDKEWAEVDENGKFVKWTTEALATEIGTKDGQIKISGLDDGVYWLHETQTKAGYDLIADMEFEIRATTANNQSYANGENENVENSPLTKLELGLKNSSGTMEYTEQDAENKRYGKVEFDVYNLKGHGLPETGGMGTTLFYLGGGAVAAVAGAMLITRKKMRKTEE